MIDNGSQDAISVSVKYRDQVLFTPAEAAELLGCSPEVIRQHVRWGGIKALPRQSARQSIKITRAELLRLIDEGMPVYSDYERGDLIDDDEAA